MEEPVGAPREGIPLQCTPTLVEAPRWRLLRWRSAPPRRRRGPPPSRTTVPGSVPKWAQPSRDRGAAAGAKQVTVTVYLPLRDAAAANALLAGSPIRRAPSYGQFLSPDAFRDRFGASDADVAAVSRLPARRRPERHRRADQQPPRRGDRHARAGRGAPSPRACTATPTAAGCSTPQHGTVGAVVAGRQGPRRDRPRPVRRPSPPAERPAGRDERGCAAGRAARRRRRRAAARRVRQRAAVLDVLRREDRDPVPGGQRPEGPVRAVRLHAVAVPGRLRHRRARRPRASTGAASPWRSPTPTRRRRSCRTPTPTRQRHGQRAFRARAVQADPAQAPVPLRLRRHGQRRPVRRAGLVRRGDPRRRGRARDGARRQRPLRRRAQLRATTPTC